MNFIVLRQRGHTKGSGSILANALGIPHAHYKSNLPATRGETIVINYGCSKVPKWMERHKDSFTNSAMAVSNCADKTKTMACLGDANVPHLDSCLPDSPLVSAWLEEDGKVIVRTLLKAHSGEGIVIAHSLDEIPQDAKLITRYFPSMKEYRVHVVLGEVILIQQKKRRNGYENKTELSRLIRTHDNGWIFAVNDLDCAARNYTEKLKTLALNAAMAVRAGHCAVDILVHLFNGGYNRSVVCEINSAPALRSSPSLEAYTTAFGKLIKAFA